VESHPLGRGRSEKLMVAPGQSIWRDGHHRLRRARPFPESPSGVELPALPSPSAQPDRPYRNRSIPKAIDDDCSDVGPRLQKVGRAGPSDGEWFELAGAAALDEATAKLPTGWLVIGGEARPLGQLIRDGQRTRAELLFFGLLWRDLAASAIGERLTPM
jgi:hypothetical protein